MSPIIGVIDSAKTGRLSTTAYESISTVTVSSSVSSVTFSSIPSGYKHLQVRGIVLTSGATNPGFQFNGDTGTTYTSHHLWGTGSTAAANNQSGSSLNNYNPSASYPSAFIMDILDYTSTTKNKASKTIAGSNTNGGTQEVAIWSGLYFPTTPAAITSITFLGNGANFTNNSRFALYGIKG